MCITVTVAEPQKNRNPLLDKGREFSSTPLRLCVSVSLCLLFAAACRGPAPRTLEVVAVPAAAIPADPGDRAWQDAPEYAAKLLPQDLVEPRLMKPSTAEVLVRAVTSGDQIAFRLQWADPAQDDLPGASQFLDACAIQIPTKIEPDLPDPQMGTPGKPVEISYWRADWQATANGREDNIRALFPNATVDHYPFDAPSLQPGSGQQLEFAKRYAPADAAGNRRAGPRQSPVEDLVAEGPGTLSPAEKTLSRAKGIYANASWSVVIVRRRPAGLAPAARTQIAFAVWEGSQSEVGSRKMRSPWIPLAVREVR